MALAGVQNFSTALVCIHDTCGPSGSAASTSHRERSMLVLVLRAFIGSYRCAGSEQDHLCILLFVSHLRFLEASL